MSLNSVNIMGNLTRDPEVRALPSGKSVCRLSIANNRIYVKNGERVTEVSYFDVDVWGSVAENCAKYLRKGSGIIVEGRLRQDRWEKDGKTQSRVTITANNVHFMPKRDDGAGRATRQESDAPSEVSSPENIAWEE
ncbi:MAG: single-stranded DNA-binding protein [Candidatus Omnitrophica bacterium]|nr:single-stranded DNA-binding protein [Candidatus Omnitrophota bacterium]